MSMITTTYELTAVLAPILRGEVEAVAFDTETTEVTEERFTPWGTETRIAGFSMSYYHQGEEVDFYVPIRHQPYDWRRRLDLLQKHDARRGTDWARLLLEDEGVTPEGTWAEGWDPNLDPAEALAQLGEVMALPGVTWIAHNWPFDASMLMADGIAPPWDRMEDTEVLSKLTDPRPLDRWLENEKRYFHGGHGLKHLGETWLGIAPDEQDRLKDAREVLRCDDWSMLPLRTIVAPYAEQDTRLTLRLHAVMLNREAYQDERVQALARAYTAEIEAVCQMMALGFLVDEEKAGVLAQESEREVGRRMKAANDLGGRVLPLNDGKALSDVLYGELGFPLYRGNRDTRQATLKQVRNRLARSTREGLDSGLHNSTAIELIDAILAYRKAEKELTSFYRPLTQGTPDGRVHTILRPMQAKTTRYSASKPNVQQMPKKGDVRTLFVPSPGHSLILCDYATQELRIGGHYALAIPEAFESRFTWPCTLAKRGDCKGRAPHGPKDDLEACRQVIHVGYRPSWSRRPAFMPLVEGFLSGDRAFDPHQAMLERCAERDIEIDRQKGKQANFALIYGAFPNKLAETLDCTPKEAQALFDVFWKEAYPELGRVRDFIDERLRRVGPETAYSHQDRITTLHGAPIFLDRGFHGLNYVIQRSCREILLHAILGVRSWIAQENYPARLLLPVHDELILEVPNDSIDETAIRSICRVMVEAGGASKVPMIVDPAIAEVSWGEASDLPTSWGYNGVTDAEDHAEGH